MVEKQSAFTYHSVRQTFPIGAKAHNARHTPQSQIPYVSCEFQVEHTLASAKDFLLHTGSHEEGAPPSLWCKCGSLQLEAMFKLS